MKMYSPPFSITNEMVSLVSEISDKLGRISNYKNLRASRISDGTTGSSLYTHRSQ